MVQTRVHFGVGLILGIVVAAIFFHFFAPRYAVIKSDSGLMKQDKWTGESWQLQENKWVTVAEDKRDWKPVDEALMKALNMKDNGGSDSAKNRLRSLKEKYPVLEPFSDEDIMERIKYIYSKKIIVDLYLNEMKVQ